MQNSTFGMQGIRIRKSGTHILQNTDQLKNRIKINNILSFMMLSAEQYKIILSISAFTLY